MSLVFPENCLGEWIEFGDKATMTATLLWRDLQILSHFTILPPACEFVWAPQHMALPPYQWFGLHNFTHNQLDWVLGFLSCTPDLEFIFICPFQCHPTLLVVMGNASTWLRDLQCHVALLCEWGNCTDSPKLVGQWEFRRWAYLMGRYWKGKNCLFPPRMCPIPIHSTQTALFMCYLCVIYFYFIYF